MAAEQRTDRREGAEARLGLLPWSREAAVGWSKGLGHERGKDQATEAIRGKGERGYNDSRFLTKTWRRCLCCALVSGAEEVQAPPSSTQQQVLARSVALLTRRQAVCRGVTITSGHSTSVFSPHFIGR